ncbi:hypothetical protein PVAND_009434 [Polypedilum vanderplanki]|uniref:Uncharacterized protein n=1 Tax=Polypedilum vanderplanki TaxID=319348 RepID=A0A9J6CCW0_POLVA|nr:hypothetical protein PVAND_009434 [Polypedilum vanderplanki]
MDGVQLEPQKTFIRKELSEMIDSGVSESSNFPIESEQLISSNIIDDVEVIKSPAKSISSESYVIETKARPNTNVKKNRQILAEEAAIKRSKAAREKPVPKKIQPEMILTHKLGKIPKYIQNKKGLSKNSSSRAISLTSDSVVSKMSEKSIKVDIKLTPKQEKQFNMSKSVPSTPNIQKSSEIEELKKIIDKQSNTISRDKLKIEDLQNLILSLKKQCKELESKNENIQVELKNSMEKNKSLELQLIRIRREEKETEKSPGIIEKLEKEIEKLVKEKQDKIYEMQKIDKMKNHEIQELKEENENLNISLEELKNSCEFYIADNEKFQKLLNNKKSLEDGDKISSVESNEIENLKNEIRNKDKELNVAKQDKQMLLKEIDHLKSQMILSTDKSISAEELSNLKEKNAKLKKREEELCKELINLKNKLDIEKNDNISKNALLEYRAEHIKALQDSESVLSLRVGSQLKEIFDLRKQVKDFEKFKLAHEEEKKNFENTLNQKFKMTN